MGLFSRKEPAGTNGRRSSARTSSEAQAAELRVRARRRLIGALVLVLTAVIFVPMLFDSPPEEEMPVPLVLPDSMPPIPSEPQMALAPETTQAASSAEAGVIQQPQPVTPAVSDANAPEEAVLSTEPEPVQEPPSASKPVTPPAASPKPAASQPASETKARTDDGSVALALLEGRKPVPAQARPSSGSGSVVLQVAAYTTESDAQSRRDQLLAAGVTNAYVENAIANGKTAYRLRVGPFPTREAAEAAQARLRQLGYNNGLIFTK